MASPLRCASATTFSITALAIAVVGSLDSLLAAVGEADGPLDTAHHPNRLLIALGCGNLVSSLFGGVPVAYSSHHALTHASRGRPQARLEHRHHDHARPAAALRRAAAAADSGGRAVGDDAGDRGRAHRPLGRLDHRPRAARPIRQRADRQHRAGHPGGRRDRRVRTRRRRDHRPHPVDGPVPRGDEPLADPLGARRAPRAARAASIRPSRRACCASKVTASSSSSSTAPSSSAPPIAWRSRRCAPRRARSS